MFMTTTGVMSSLGSNSIVTVTIATILIQLIDCSGVAGISLAPVFWNLTNPIFKASKNDHIIVVNLFDEIDFVCPYYSSTTTDASELEYYLIYRVSKKEYDDCNIYSEHSKLHILRCRDPRQKRRFTILFEPFQSIPNVPEYKAGHTYYFITPSTGRQDGLDNLYKGACLQHNMKLTIKVRDGDYEAEEVPHRRPANQSAVDQQGSDFVQENFNKDSDFQQRGHIPSLERSAHHSVPSNHGSRTPKPPSSKNSNRKESQRHSQSNSDDSGQLSSKIDVESETERPFGHVARPTHSFPLHHNTRSPKSHSSRNSHRKETHRQSQSNSEDSDSVSDLPNDQEAFPLSGNDQPSPSSALGSWSSSALRLTPFRRSPLEATLLLMNSIVTIAFAIDRWSHISC